jgi:hypothetical protein
METTYTQQAEAFLAKHGLTFKAELAADQAPPAWDMAKGFRYVGRSSRDNCGDYNGEVVLRCGDKWDITISRGTHRLQFPFWSSIADKARRLGLVRSNMMSVAAEKLPRPDKDHKPTAYDVLACISNDANTPADFEEFCSDFGYDTDSRKAEDTHRRCVTFALKLRQFFTATEFEELQEIN